MTLSAPIPIGAFASSPLRWLLVLSGVSRSFFYRLTQAPGADRFGQRIGLHTNPLGDLRDLQSLIELFLRLFQHLCGQHCRPPRLGLLIESRYPFLPIKLDGPFDTDERDAKGAGNIRLFGVSIDAKLRGDHAKGRNIILGVNEYRHVPVEIGYLAIPFFKGQF